MLELYKYEQKCTSISFSYRAFLQILLKYNMLFALGDHIDMQAFIDYMATYRDFRDNDQEYAECFRTFDKENKGKLSRSDIQ